MITQLRFSQIWDRLWILVDEVALIQHDAVPL